MGRRQRERRARDKGFLRRPDEDVKYTAPPPTSAAGPAVVEGRGITIPMCSDTLDKILGSVSAMKSRTFYDLQNGNASWEAVKNIIQKKKKPVRFPVWVRHHWIAVEVDEAHTNVYDSATSKVVQCDVKKFLCRLELPAPRFVITPQQARGSNQCGLFTAMFLHARALQLRIPTTAQKWDLVHLTRCETQQEFVEAVKQLLLPPEAGTPPTLSNEDIRNALEAAVVGSRVRHIFTFRGSPESLYTRFGTVEGVPVSRRPAGMKWAIRFEHYAEEDDEDTPSPTNWGDTVESFPLSTDTVETISVEVLRAPANEVTLPAETDRPVEEVNNAPTQAERDYPAPPRREPVDAAWAKIGNLEAHVSGAEFVKWELLDYEQAAEKYADTLAWGAVTNGVRRGHIRELSRFQKYVKTLSLSTPVDSHLQLYLDAYVNKRRLEGTLSWSTVIRVIGSLIGAFAHLDFYMKTGGHLHISRWPSVRQMLTHATRLAARSGSKEPQAATPAQVNTAIKSLRQTDHEAAAALALCWYTAQRPCDVLLLHSSNVKRVAERRYVLRFGEGKVVGRIEAYHIHVNIPNQYDFDVVNTWLEKKHHGRFVFAPSMQARRKVIAVVREALRTVDKGLELRSLRRGTLQTYHAAGIPENALLAYSRHTTVEALRRYLGWGAIATDEQRCLMDKAEAITAGDAVTCLYPEKWLGVSADGTIEVPTDHPPPPLRRHVDRSGYRLLAKQQTVNPVKVDVLDEMAKECSQRVRAFYQTACQWRDGHENYDRVPVAEATPSRIPTHMLQQSIEATHTVPVSRSEEHMMRNYCDTFVINEDAKVPPRSRMVIHPTTHNQHVDPKSWNTRIANTTRRQARLAVLEQKGCISFDFAGWYQQIPVAPSVSWHQCFKARNAWYRYTRLPTGASWSADVATAHTLVLLDGTPSQVDVAVCIDNVRFAGSDREATVAAAWRFVQRCRSANAELNELDVHTATQADVEQLYTTTDDFMGDVANYTTSMVGCRQKHVDRLREYAAAAVLPGATNATIFGCYAMLIYMGETLGDRLVDRRQIRLWFSRRARDLARGHINWEGPPNVRLPKAELLRWVADVAENQPATLVRRPDPTVVVQIDACRMGYAAIIVREAQAYMIQRRWTASEVKTLALHRSSNSEPEAIARVSEHLQQEGVQGTHLFVTDHEQFVAASEKGHSLSGANNARLSRLAPWTQLVFEPGSQSLADAYSRFHRNTLSQAHKEEAVQRAQRYLNACKRGKAYGIVGKGRSYPARVFHTPHASEKDTL